MPKVTKKKKEKQADFTKAKLKLGKGKKQASNATNTSFKARSIALPGQDTLARALAQDEGTGTAEPTTANGLTLEDLFARFRHPNAGVRKESLGGVKDILSLGVWRDTGKVMRALGGLVSDDDAAVRKALLGLLSWYLPLMPVAALSPHLPLLVLQTSSALSHIFPEIRLDACKLVHLLLTHVPNHVVGSWPHQPSNILEGLRLAVGLGGEKGVNSQIGRLTGGAKLVTLRAMAEFVRKGLKIQEGQNGEYLEGWIESRLGDDRAPLRSVTAEPTLEDLRMEGWVAGGSWDLEKEVDNAWELGRLGAQGSNEDDDSVISVLSQLYISLYPLLQSTFLEAAPTAFSPSSTPVASAGAEDVPMALCTITATLTELLARSILTRAPATLTPELKEVKNNVSDFLRRMAAWFPFHTSRSAAPTPSGVSPALELSMTYANLAVLLAPRPVTLKYPKDLLIGRREVTWKERVRAVDIAWNDMREREKGKGKGKANGADLWAMEEVAQWVVDTLAPKKDILSQAQGLTPASYSALLPIIFSLLIRPPTPTPTRQASASASSTAEDDIPTMIGTAFLAHLSRQASTSGIRSLGDDFVISLIDVHEQRFPTYPFFIPSANAGLRTAFRGWFESLPKVLWELGNRDEQGSKRLLTFMLRLGLRGKDALEPGYSLLEGQAFPSIATRLAPLFHLSHPSRGPMPGPWTRMASADAKRLALDVAKVWIEWDDGKLAHAVERAVKGTEWEAYWVR
ncbi:hypothetical protein IAU60_003312 [Kwoniella sp. DSM 27419]